MFDDIADAPPGAIKPGAFDDIVNAPPGAAARPVGEGEMFGRRLQSALGGAGTYFGRALAAPAAIVDYATGGRTRLFDTVFDAIGGGAARNMAERGTLQPGETPITRPIAGMNVPTGGIAGGVGEFVGMIPDLIFGAKGTSAATPLLNAGARSAYEASAPILSRIMPDATRGATTMFPAATRSATQQYGELVDKGVDPLQAAGAATVGGTSLMAMGAAPAAMPGALPARMASGAGFNVTSGMASRQAQNAVLPDNLQQPVVDPASMALDTLLGMAFGAAGPRSAGPALRPDAAPVYDRWDHMPIETPEQAAARTAPPEASAAPAPLDPNAIAKQVADRLFQMADEGAAPKPPEVPLVPKSAEQRLPPTRPDVSEPQVRVPDWTIEGQEPPAPPKAPEPLPYVEPAVRAPDDPEVLRENIDAAQQRMADENLNRPLDTTVYPEAPARAPLIGDELPVEQPIRGMLPAPDQVPTRRADPRPVEQTPDGQAVTPETRDVIGRQEPAVGQQPAPPLDNAPRAPEPVQEPAPFMQRELQAEVNTAPKMETPITPDDVRGRQIDVEVEVGDTGRKVQIKMDAGNALADVDKREAALRAMRDCL